MFQVCTSLPGPTEGLENRACSCELVVHGLGWSAGYCRTAYHHSDLPFSA